MHSRWTSILLAVAALATASCVRDPQKLKRVYVSSGDQYVAQKNYSEAIIQYRNAVAQDPRFGEARFKLALAYEAVGEPSNALPEFIRAADLMPDSVDAQLHTGRLLLEARQYPEAKARALRALAKEPKNIDALTLMGNALTGLKDYEGAISQIEEAIGSDPHRSLSYANLGMVQLFKGDTSAAEATFKRAVDIDPKSASAHMSLANYYWAGGNASLAEREMKTAFAIDPTSPAVTRTLATFYLSSGRAAEAEQYLKAYAGTGTEVEPALILADYYLAARRVKDATDVLDRISKVEKGFVPAGLRLAYIDFNAGKRAEAYGKVEAALARQPKNEDALLTKARFLISDQKFGDALKLAKSVTAANPQSAGGHFVSALALQATGATDDAIKELQEVLRLRPTANVAVLRLADIYLARGDAAAAAEFSNQALKNDPQSSIALLLAAKSQLRLGNLARAEPQVLALAKSNPRSDEVQMLLGDLYWAKRDLTHAGEAYARALELKGTSIQALASLIRVDLAQKKPEAARSRLESRLAAAPDDSALLLLAGGTFRVIGDSARAEAVFRHVLDVDQSNMEAFINLGGIYMSEKRLDEAKKEYEEAARRQPKMALAATTMVGVILSLQNRQDEARKHYEQALALDPQAPVAANNLAWELAEQGGNLDTALKLAQAAKARLPKDSQVSDTLGWIYYKKGLASLAVTTLREGAEQNPSDPAIHYHLGLAYLKNGDRIEAQKSLQHALRLNPTFEGAEDAKRALATIKG